MSRLKNIWREPLFHFLLIGALLFLVFDVRQDEDSTAPNRILVDSGQLAQFVARFERTRLRPPTETELAGLIEGYIRDEVYYREALAMGLDQDDPVVRQRMGLKLDFLLDDLAAEELPDDELLAAYMQRNPNKFRDESQHSFVHVYFNPDKHQDLAADVEKALTRLKDGAPPATQGDRMLVEPAYEMAGQSEIARVFGGSFAEQLVKLEPGGWAGPFESGYGVHLVMVTARQDERFPAFEEIRGEVQREYMVERRQELKDATYQKLREGYEIVVESAATPQATQ